jgi:hypothetical protein
MTPDINQILRKDPVWCGRGAPMGRSDWHDSKSPLYLQKVRMVDGDYAPDGTYWGSGTPLWCAFNGTDDRFVAGAGTRIYLRAIDRKDAKVQIQARYPGVTFRR